jgi:hypothetical protein
VAIACRHTRGFLQMLQPIGIVSIMTNTKFRRSILVLSLIGIVCASTDAALIVRVQAPKTIAQKTIVKLTMKNTFKEKVESARAQVFLLDDSGKIVGQAAQWIIGGTKEKPALAPNAETAFNFVVNLAKPLVATNLTSKVSFSRIILEGGKLADVNKDVQIETP